MQIAKVKIRTQLINFNNGAILPRIDDRAKKKGKVNYSSEVP